MNSKNKINPAAILRIAIVIPLALFLIIAIASCSGSRKVAKTQKESLPPPPPPPPPPVPEDKIYIEVEEMPKYPGGDTALMSFVYKNVQYPKEAKEKGIQGRVVVRFAINYLGGIEQVSVIKGVDPLLDAESVRVISMLPAWQPGKQGGKPVNVWYTVPVTFRLK